MNDTPVQVKSKAWEDHRWVSRGRKYPSRMERFVFTIAQLKKHRNLKIVVHTPHNTLLVMWGRDKNFQFSMLFSCEIANFTY